MCTTHTETSTFLHCTLVPGCLYYWSRRYLSEEQLAPCLVALCMGNLAGPSQSEDFRWFCVPPSGQPGPVVGQLRKPHFESLQIWRRRPAGKWKLYRYNRATTYNRAKKNINASRTMRPASMSWRLRMIAPWTIMHYAIIAGHFGHTVGCQQSCERPCCAVKLPFGIN